MNTIEMVFYTWVFLSFYYRILYEVSSNHIIFTGLMTIFLMYVFDKKTKSYEGKEEPQPSSMHQEI